MESAAMSRPRHPNKHIEQAVARAEALGWRVELSNGHTWGRLFCPMSTRAGCIVAVYSTPRVPENHASRIGKLVESCAHAPEP